MLWAVWVHPSAVTLHPPELWPCTHLAAAPALVPFKQQRALRARSMRPSTPQQQRTPASICGTHLIPLIAFFLLLIGANLFNSQTKSITRRAVSLSAYTPEQLLNVVEITCFSRWFRAVSGCRHTEVSLCTWKLFALNWGENTAKMLCLSTYFCYL